jgi:hypothetical protein
VVLTSPLGYAKGRYGIDLKIRRPITVSGIAVAQIALLRFDDHAAISSAKARAAN